jgi:hypothetical protein
MKGKLAALGTLVTAFAILEGLFYPRSILPRDLQTLAVRLLPPTIGSFRSTEWWMSNWPGQRVEVYTRYRDGRAVEADVDIWLGAWMTHNGIGCLYILGDQMFWQRLSNITTANSNAIFDTALFRDDQGLALLANTECYLTGCGETLVPEDVADLGLRLPVFFKSAETATPVSILVRELNDPSANSTLVQGARLVQDFERFTARLDLSPLLAGAAAHRDGNKRRGGSSP